MKKGEISLTFNWIYIAVVGGLILIGAVASISKIRKESSENFYFDAKAYAMNFINQMQQSTGAQRSLGMYDASLQIRCDGFSAEDSEASGLSLEYYSVFSPDLIKNKLSGYSAYFGIPMKSVPFIYLTSPYKKYFIIDSADSKKLMQIFPKTFSEETVSDFGVTDYEGYYKIRFITFGAVPNSNELGELRYDK